MGKSHERLLPIFESTARIVYNNSDESVGRIIKQLIHTFYLQDDDTAISTTLEPLEMSLYLFMLKEVHNYEKYCKQQADNRAKAKEVKANQSTTNGDQKPPKANQSTTNGDQRGVNININENINKNINENKNINSNNTLMSGKPDGRVVEIVDYLNLVLGTHYKVNGKKTGSLIRSRLKEGYTVEDFKQVISKKYAEWAGTEREKYLRPETLFCADHFEGYLNQTFVKEERKKGPVETAKEEWAEWLRQQEQQEQQQQEQGGNYIDTDGICEADDDSVGFLPEFI